MRVPDAFLSIGRARVDSQGGVGGVMCGFPLRCWMQDLLWVLPTWYTKRRPLLKPLSRVSTTKCILEGQFRSVYPSLHPWVQPILPTQSSSVKSLWHGLLKRPNRAFVRIFNRVGPSPTYVSRVFPTMRCGGLRLCSSRTPKVSRPPWWLVGNPFTVPVCAFQKAQRMHVGELVAMPHR